MYTVNIQHHILSTVVVEWYTHKSIIENDTMKFSLPSVGIWHTHDLLPEKGTLVAHDLDGDYYRTSPKLPCELHCRQDQAQSE